MTDVCVCMYMQCLPYIPQFRERQFSTSGGLVPMSQKSLETSVSVLGLRHLTVRVLTPHPHVFEHWVEYTYISPRSNLRSYARQW